MTTRWRACRGCTSGRSAISSTRCDCWAATFATRGNDGYPPLAIGSAGGRAGGRVPIRGDVSSQFLSALLMALPIAQGARDAATTVTLTTPLISRPYVEITTRLMRRFGVAVADARSGDVRRARDVRLPEPRRLHVEGDASAASYFLAAGVIGGGPVRVTGVGRDSIQGDVAFADVLARQGADIRYGRRLDRGAARTAARRRHDRLHRRFPTPR